MEITVFHDPEAAEARAPVRPQDAVSEAVGSPHFVRSHRFANLAVATPMGRSPRLAVSRYYWDAEPPVAVDFRRELKYGRMEVSAKSLYCEERSIRYVLVEDEWDGTTAAAQLPALAGRPVEPEPDAEAAESEAETPRPVSAPRSTPRRSRRAGS